MGVDKISENSVPRWFKLFNLFALILVLCASIYVISADLNDSVHKTTGAGDIWWVSAPEVEQSYQSIVNKSKN